MAYCSNIWKDSSYDGIDLTSEGVRDFLKSDCRYHESLIVGKKIQNGSCHLLIRNSWGDRWRRENKQWKCVCRDRLSEAYVDDCQPSTHSDEQYSIDSCWMPLDTLIRNVGTLTLIE